jgi:hypothetical protein
MAEQEGPNPLNMDFKFLALTLLCATRTDLYNDYLEGGNQLRYAPDRPKQWDSLISLGLSEDLLRECLFAFKDQSIQRALLDMQRLTATLVSLNDYCSFPACPSFDACSRLVACIGGIVENIPTVDAEEPVTSDDLARLIVAEKDVEGVAA